MACGLQWTCIIRVQSIRTTRYIHCIMKKKKKKKERKKEKLLFMIQAQVIKLISETKKKKEQCYRVYYTWRRWQILLLYTDVGRFQNSDSDRKKLQSGLLSWMFYRGYRSRAVGSVPRICLGSSSDCLKGGRSHHQHGCFDQSSSES
jgi:hypothetical protein